MGQFCTAVESIRRAYGGWITSWGRTDQHSRDVGGEAGDPHTWGLGADMLYHVRPDITQLTIDSAEVGLHVIREELKPHDHFQPLDFPPGPVASYGGRMKTWA